MLGLGPQELLIILIIVLVIFGGKRLPEIGNAFGKSIREFKKATRKGKEDKDEVSGWIGPQKDSQENHQSSSARSGGEENNPGGDDQMDRIPGIKEAQEIKKTAGKIKAASRLFLRK